MRGISSSIGLRGEPRAQDRAGGARLAIAFQRDAGERAGDEGEVVEGGPGPGPQRAEPADAIPRQLGLDLDVFDDRGRERARRLARRGIAADPTGGLGRRIEPGLSGSDCSDSVDCSDRSSQIGRDPGRSRSGGGQGRDRCPVGSGAGGGDASRRWFVELAKVLLGRLGEVGMIGQLEHAMKIGGGVVDEPLLDQADSAVAGRVSGSLARMHHELAEVGEGAVEVAALGADLAALEVG